MNSIFQRAGFVFGLILLLLMAVGIFFVWSISNRYSARISVLQAAGKPVTLGELAEEAALRDSGTAVLKDVEMPLVSLELKVAEAGETGDQAKESEKRIAAFHEFESGQPELIDLLRQGAAERGGAGRVTYDQPAQVFLGALYNRIGLYRSAGRALAYHAEAELDAGNPNEAALDAISILQWSDKQGLEPAMVCYMSSVAMRSSGLGIAADCLYTGELDDKIRSDLLDKIQQHDRVAAWSRMIDSERVVGLELFNEMPSVIRFGQTMSGRIIEYLDTMDHFEKLGANDWGAGPGTLNITPTTTMTIAPLLAALDASRRVQAQATAIHILAQWQDQQSPEDAKVEDLNLPKSVTTDPYDNAVMKLKMTADGPIIYSVGKNGHDDGGLIPAGDSGIAPPASR